MEGEIKHDILAMKSNIAAMEETVRKDGDKGMMDFLRAWKNECIQSNMLHLYTFALAGLVQGIVNTDITTVWIQHHKRDMSPADDLLKPPLPQNKNGRVVAYSTPGKFWQQVARMLSITCTHSYRA